MGNVTLVSYMDIQWSGSDTVCEDKQDKIKEELADVLWYCILMADRCGLDMDEIV